jgi:hypothetical protein
MYDFPSSPSVGQLFPTTSPMWQWDGEKWVAYSSQVPVGLSAKYRVFSTIGAQSYVPTPGTICAFVECQASGGGGNGGTSDATHCTGGGGGTGGAYANKWLTAAQIGASQTITVPGGTVAGATGGDCSFGALCIAKGGPGATTAGSTGVIGAPGAATPGGSVGDLIIPGGIGDYAPYFAVAMQWLPEGARGGDAHLGRGAPPIAQGGGGTSNGLTGQLWGGGGGGGVANQVAGTATGGAGAQGCCLVTEFGMFGSAQFFPVTVKKNYIVNGAMMISQENGITAGTTVNYYPVDQFFVPFSNAGTQTSQAVLSQTPAGSPNRLRVTATVADASVAAGDYLAVLQRIEGFRIADLKFGTAAAKTITLQFGCRGPAGTYCVSIENGAQNRAYTVEYVIAAGEANTDVVKSVTIPGDVTGTWATDASIGLQVVWSLMCGTTFQTPANAWAGGNFFASANQFNFMGTGGNVFELFDVGLYEGTVAPSFVVPDYATEIRNCQRYYEVSDKIAQPFAPGFIYSTSIALGNYIFKEPKRTNPTFVAAGAAADYGVYRGGNNNAIDTLPTMDSANTQSAMVRHTHSTAPFTLGQGCILSGVTANAQYRFNSRL